MCNQSLQEVDLFMGLQNYRQRTLSYVLKRLPAAPSIQQGTIIWSSRCAQYHFSQLFFISATISDCFCAHHSSSSRCAPAPWEAVENKGCRAGTWSISHGWAAMWKRAVPGCAEDALGEGFLFLSTAVPILASFLLGTKQQVEPVSHCIFKYWICTCKVVPKFGSFAFPFFFPSPWTELLTQEEVGYAVTYSIKRPNKSSS